MKKTPQRMCIACRMGRDKNEFIRFVKLADGGVILDKTGKAMGRGAYVCNNTDCVKKAIKQRALNRAFKCEIAPEIYRELEETVGE